jgi:hypothetical protein
MTITAELRHQLEVADRTRDIDVIMHIVDDMLVEHTDVTPLDIEMCFRDAAAQTYLVADDPNESLSVVLGMPAWRDALNDAGMTPDQNRTALAAMSTRD